MKTVRDFLEELDKYDPNMYVVVLPRGQHYEPTLHIPELEIIKETWNVNTRKKPPLSECINMLTLYPGNATHQRD